MSDVKRWCEAMDCLDEQRVVLSNLMYDVDENRVQTPVAADLLDRAVVAWGRAFGVNPSAADPIAILESVVDETAETSFCRGPKVAVSADVSRVTDHLGVWRNHLNQAAFGTPRRSIPNANFWRGLTDYKLSDAQVRKSEIRSRSRPIGWITTRDLIDKLRAEARSEAELANSIRDTLGLDHFSRGILLLELRYPTGSLDSTRVAAPTIVEGGTKIVYRSICGAEGWGRAVHLTKDPAEEGGPEAVHLPIPFTSKFKIAFIGEVPSTAPIIPASELLKRCPRQWAAANDVARLEQIVAEKV